MTFLTLLALTPCLRAQVIDPQNIVLEQVYIASRDAEDVPVNLLIRDNKLELVSEDEIPIPDGFAALDANGGYLIGILALGESPSFMILDGDPRIDFGVLLDADSRAVFVVHDGELLKNSLQYAKDMFEAKPEGKRWSAYTPPPVALPTSYGDTGAWNHWTTEKTRVVLFGAMAIDRQFWMSQNEASEQQVGSLDKFGGGEIRDIRIGLLGTINLFERPLGYNVAVASNAFDKRFESDGKDNYNFIDYRLDIPVPGGLTLGIGKQKEPISMERLMPLVNVPLQERSSGADALLRSRNFGALLSGSAKRRVSWAGGVFNTFIDSDLSIDQATTSLTGRVTGLPFISKDQSNLLHLGFAARLLDGNEGYQYRTEPEFNKSPVFVDTGLGDTDRILQYNLEASWRRGPFWLAAEYIGTGVDSPLGDSLYFSGYKISGSWILTGEMREYRYKSGTFGPAPVSRSVRQKGKGTWEVAARWSSVDLTDGPVDGGEMDILSFGINWWLLPSVSVNWNYRYILNNREDLDGRASGSAFRLLMLLQ
ncbi:MAG: porin [Acidobacteriota bacterium]